MTRSAAQVRQDFIDFFCRRHGHEFVRSAPVVPHDDPTLLFTNAGMNQFKPYFLGTETPKHPRVANTQKCIRVSGKHNDLDDVGHDTYHHTFFEMLGNWSFGDYFKKEAIAWAWELLTEVWGLDKTRLHATYFRGDEAEGLQPDLEAKELWASVTEIDPTHIHPGSKKDNFWEMGDVGPCGPCSEIHIDLTPDKSGRDLVNAGDARVIEIWNLVFIQFNSTMPPEGLGELHKWDVTPQNERPKEFVDSYKSRDEILSKYRQLKPLPARHVDTGMGFERVCALLQGKSSNYDTDLFTPILQAIRDITGAPPYAGTLPEEPRTSVRAAPETPGTTNGMQSDGPRGLKPAAPHGASQDHDRTMIDVSYRVIADHIRCLTFALTDGAVPDREGRGYVLRRILRRAVFYGRQYLNMHAPFLFRLVPTVVDVMANAFAELRTAHGGKNVEYVAELIREEEESFYRTLDRGIALFDKAATYEGFGFIEQHKNEPSLREFLLERIGSAPNPSVKYAWTFNPEPEAIAKLDWRELRFVDRPTISGEDAFMLHDTYGFPIDLTQIMADEKGLRVDIGEYERLMEEARERARQTGTVLAKAVLLFGGHVQRFPGTDDSPKYAGDAESATVLGILRYKGTAAECDDARRIDTGEVAGLVLDRTCFYAEAGGQVGDRGTLGSESVRFDVEDTQAVAGVVVHLGTLVQGTITIGQELELKVDPNRRATMQNHTATHVLNWALREVLGDHVQQKGSLVDHEKTRFDFSHPKALTPREIERVEQLVNEKIEANLPVDYKTVPQEDALRINGLRAVFGERYPDMVRVMSVGVPVEKLIENPGNPDWRQYSIEFCGGTHLKATGEIECFVLASEEAVAKGIRRIVGLTGPTAHRTEQRGAELVQQAEQLRTGPAQAVLEGLSALQTTLAAAQIPARHRTRLRELTAELQRIVRKQQKADAAGAAGVVNARIDELLAAAERIGETTVVVAEMPDVPIDQLKNGADRIKQTRRSAAVLFGVRVGGEEATERRSDEATKATHPSPERQRAGRPTGMALLLAAMSNDLVKKGLKAGDLVKHIAPIIKGAGGGPPTMAQAGGKEPQRLPDALQAGRSWIAERLG